MAWTLDRWAAVPRGLIPSVLLATLMAACTGAPPANPRVPPPGASDAFVEGYVLGCMSGYADAGRDGYQSAYHRDDQRYGTDQEYRAGWDKAHQACYEDERRYPFIRREGAGQRTSMH